MRRVPIQCSHSTNRSNYSWPGNVRELQNVIRGALIASPGPVLLPTFLPTEVMNEETTNPEEALSEVADDVVSWQAIPSLLDRWLAEGEEDIYRRALDKFDRFIIGRVMRFTSGNQVHASELLGLSRVTIRNRLRAFVTQDNLTEESSSP